MVDIFDVLADGTRRELLRTLREHDGEVSVSELVAELGISQPTVSKHLKVLRDHGLVSVREEGQHRYYRLDPGPLGELEGWLVPFAAGGKASAGGSAASAAAAAPASAVAAAASSGAAASPAAPWAGAEVGDRVGRVAAESAHSARIAFEAAQEKLQGAQKRVADRLPRWRRDARLASRQDVRE